MSILFIDKQYIIHMQEKLFLNLTSKKTPGFLLKKIINTVTMNSSPVFHDKQGKKSGFFLKNNGT